MLRKLFRLAGLMLVALNGAGCGTYVAHRLAQAPNTYPSWLSPEPRVVLSLGSRVLQAFPPQVTDVGPPDAQLCFRIVEPADYALSLTSTNWVQRHQTHFAFSMRTTLPARPRAEGSPLRGTAVLLHGYGLDQMTMLPWALQLAQEGWRCILLDLRGHGDSTGPRIYYGLQEARDLSQVLDELDRRGALRRPVVSVGESYGAALALRWKALDPRVKAVVAIAPYGHLSAAAQNIRGEYASWFPKRWLNAGLKRLPALLNSAPRELDTVTVLQRQPQPIEALFVAGAQDKIATVLDVTELRQHAAPTSPLLIVPKATHEALPFFFEDLTGPVTNWLARALDPIASR